MFGPVRTIGCPKPSFATSLAFSCKPQMHFGSFAAKKQKQKPKFSELPSIIERYTPKVPPKQKKFLPSPVTSPERSPNEADRRYPRVGVAALEGHDEEIKLAKSFFENSDFHISWFHAFPEGTNLHHIKVKKLSPNVREKIENSDFLFCVHNGVVSLKHLKEATGAYVYVDFVGGKEAYRREMLAKLPKTPMTKALKSCGKPLEEVSIVDVTGGLGRDAHIMAALGCKLTVLENNAIIYTLLKNGIERAKESPDTAPIMERINLIFGDSRKYLASLKEEERPDIVYLDPMYPSHKRINSKNNEDRSQVSKGMQIIRALNNKECDSYGLLEASKAAAKLMVVLKRPYYVEVDPKCIRSYQSNITHWDVYKAGKLQQNQQTKAANEKEREAPKVAQHQS